MRHRGDEEPFSPSCEKILQENFVMWLKVNFYPTILFLGRFAFHLFKVKQLQAHSQKLKIEKKAAVSHPILFQPFSSGNQFFKTVL